MQKFAVPSTLYIAITLILPPMLIGFIEQWFPTNAYWWAALLVVLLNALVMVVKAVYTPEVIKVEQNLSSVPAGALGQARPTVTTTEVAKPPFLMRLVVTGD